MSIVDAYAQRLREKSKDELLREKREAEINRAYTAVDLIAAELDRRKLTESRI